MADIEAAKRALVKAHEAGDTDAAKKLAKYIKSEQQTQAQAQTPAKKPFPKQDYGLKDALVSGMTLGLSDHAAALGGAIGAGIGGALTGDGFEFDYGASLAARRDAQRRYAEENPVLSPAAEIGGGVIAGVPLAARAMAGAKGLGSATARGAGVGAGMGAVSGAATNDEDRLGGAVMGGTVGAAVGTAAPTVIAGAGKAVGLARDQLASRAPASAVARRFRDATPGMTPKQIEARVAELGPEAMLADVNPTTRGLAETVATAGGQGRRTIEAALEGRQAGQGQRVAQAAGRELNPLGANFTSLMDEISQTQRRNARPLYEVAMNRGPAGGVTSPRVERVLRDPIGQIGLRRGLEIQRIEAVADNVPFNPKDYAVDFDESGAVKLIGVPNMRLLDAVKRGLDDIIEKAREPVTGRIKWSERLQAIDRLRRSYIDELDRLNPDYKIARQAWAGEAAIKDAMVKGRDFILRSDPDVSAKMIARMSDGEKEAFRIGVAKAIESKVFKASDTANAVRGIFGNRMVRDRLRQAFPDEASFKRFEAAMEAEAEKFKTLAQSLGNSRTALREAQLENFGTAEGEIAANIAAGSVSGTVGSAVRAAVEFARRPPKKVREELAKVLTTIDPAERAAFLRTLKAEMVKKRLGPRVQNRLSGAVIGGATAELPRPWAR